MAFAEVYDTKNTKNEDMSSIKRPLNFSAIIAGPHILNPDADARETVWMEPPPAD